MKWINKRNPDYNNTIAWRPMGYVLKEYVSGMTRLKREEWAFSADIEVELIIRGTK